MNIGKEAWEGRGEMVVMSPWCGFCLESSSALLKPVCIKNVFEHNDCKLSIEYCRKYDVIKRVTLVSVVDSSGITNTSFIFYCYAYGPFLVDHEAHSP